MYSLGGEKYWMCLNEVDLNADENVDTTPEAQLQLKPHTVWLVTRDLMCTEQLTV